MAIKKFKDTHNLINYLCQEDVLGELEVEFSFAGMGWNTEFNFDYPELEEHLNVQLYISFLDCVWMVYKVEVVFANAEEYDVSGESDFQLEDKPYIEQILLLIRESVEKVTSRNDVYAIIDFEEKGDSFNVKNITINRFEIYDWNDDEKSIPVDEDLKVKILNGILDILSNTRSGIECINEYEFSMMGQEDFYYCQKGSPGFYDVPDLKDEVKFELDTSLLIKK